MSEIGGESVPDPMIGQHVRGYVIRRKLAEGGMGAVYLATHERLETRKVIKILLPEYARQAMLRERFEREALAVSRLRHKYIVTIDDYGQFPDGQLFLMMPFLEGRSLDEYLRQHGKFTEHRALHILVQVCSALQYMHDAAIVHRDIKPSNIFIVSDDDNPYRVVLIDLGIAKSLRDRDLVTSSGSAIGTPAYMAVEQYEDAASVTPLADLYSVAIVAWELVTGSLPWGMHTSHVLYAKQKQERPRRPSGMSEPWYAVLLSALAVHPYDRPQSMRALAAALASTVPAIPPYVPSGAEILAKLAKSFVQNAPHDDETVRNGAQPDRVAPILWPPRETHAPTDGMAGSSLDAAARAGDNHAQPTTLAASTGVAIIQPARRSWAVSVGLGLAVAALTTFAVYLAARTGVRELRSTATSGVAAGSNAVGEDSRTVLSSGPGVPVRPDASVSDAPLAVILIDAAPSPDAAAVAVPAASAAGTQRTPLRKTFSATSSPAWSDPHPTRRGSGTARASGSNFDPEAAGGDD